MLKKIIIALVLLSVIYCDKGVHPRTNQWCEPNMYKNYYWDGYKCELCAWNCKCSQHKACDSCSSSYSKWTNTTIGVICTSCQYSYVDSCCFQENNLNGVRALTCSSGAELHGSYCHKVSYCKTGAYNDYGTCYACQDGYYLNQNQGCSECQAYDYAERKWNAGGLCTECEGPNSCKACQAGYYLYQYDSGSTKELKQDGEKQGSMCVKCYIGDEKTQNTNCYCTSSDRICQSCHGHTYYVTETKNCKACTMAGCSKCKSVAKDADAEQCESCYSGYVLQTEEKIDKCIPCPDHCSDCTAILQTETKYQGSCKSDGCNNEYYFKQGDSGETTQPNTCIACTLGADTNSLRCNGPLAADITQCKQEDKSTTFDALTGQYFPDTAAYYLLTVKLDDDTETKQCVLNQHECRDMIQSPTPKGNLIGMCSTCYDGYLKIEVKDGDSITSSVCEQCNKPNCVECAVSGSSLVCKTCNSNNPVRSWETRKNVKNYIVDATGSCKECGSGCQICTNDNCTTCQASYRLAKGTCSDCTVNHCKNCDAGTDSCDTCFEGFTYYSNPEKSDNRCIQCEVGCGGCSVSNRKACSYCLSGYYLRGGQCYPPVANCISHTADGLCTYCKYGYRSVQGRCRPCSGDKFYATCAQGCTNLYYSRDGLSLSKEYETKKNDEISKGDASFSSVLLFNVVFALLGIFFIFV